MLEGLALTVEVCEEVLRAFGKVENGFEIDYLCAGRGDVGKGTGQEAEIAQVGHEVDGGIMDVFGHRVRIGLTVAGAGARRLTNLGISAVKTIERVGLVEFWVGNEGIEVCGIGRKGVNLRQT